MNILNVFQQIFCCGSATDIEEQAILPASGGIDTYAHVRQSLATSNVRTPTIMEKQTASEDEADDDYSLSGTPTKKSVGTSSANSSPGFAFGLNIQTNAKHHDYGTSVLPELSDDALSSLVGTPAKQSTGTHSVQSSPGFSFGFPIQDDSLSRKTDSDDVSDELFLTAPQKK